MMKAMRRLLSAGLALVLMVLPVFALAETDKTGTLEKQIDGLVEQINALLVADPAFEYNGETFHLSDGVAYANEFFWQTEDYYPYCDALLEARIEYSNQIGELYLQEVALRNQLAGEYGYDNYVELAYDIFEIDFDMTETATLILQSYPRSINFLMWNGNVRDSMSGAVFLDREAFLRDAAAMYGQISPEYQPMLEALVGSDAFVSETVPRVQAGGYTEADAQGVSVYIGSYDDINFSTIAIHEFGHYLHEVIVFEEEERGIFPVYETHSVAGTLLCADMVEALFREQTGEEYGALLTLCYLMDALSTLPYGCMEVLLTEDIYLHPENYQPEDIAQRYLELCLSVGYDGGYSEEYQMLVGTEWLNNTLMFSRPFYTISYPVGATNALWLWREQENGGDAIELYNELIATPVPDVSYADFCRQMGLPDLLDSETYAGMDDFLCNKLVSLYTEAYGEQ